MKKTIVDTLKDYDMEIESAGSVLRAFCPFHDDTSKPNFTVYPATESWFCFACNVGGNIIKFISMIENIPYAEAELRVNGQNIEVAELKDRLTTQTEEVQTFNVEVNIQVSRHCRQYLQAHPERAEDVIGYLKTLDQKLEQEISYDKMKEILDFTKKTFTV